jgi:hypothetical protein
LNSRADEWPITSGRAEVSVEPRRPSEHQRKSLCVKHLVGALARRRPCIAVMGLVPAACNRVDETTGGAAHDVRRGNWCPSMPRRARPDRQLMSTYDNAQEARVVSVRRRVPRVAMSGSQALPVVIRACRCRRIAAAITVWVWVGVSLLVPRVVRW